MGAPRLGLSLPLLALAGLLFLANRLLFSRQIAVVIGSFVVQFALARWLATGYISVRERLIAHLW